MKTKHKLKLGRPTKVESAAIQYARDVRTHRSKALQVTVHFGTDTKDYNEVAPFLGALRSRRHGLLSIFVRDAVIKAVRELTHKS